MIEVNLARVNLIQYLDKAQTGYSMFCTTDISNLLDVMFGTEVGFDLTSASATKRIRDTKLLQVTHKNPYGTYRKTQKFRVPKALNTTQ